MSVRAYLKSGIQEHITAIQVPATRSNCAHTSRTIHGVSVEEDHGLFHVGVDATGRLPEEVRKHVDFYTLHDSFATRPRRALGVYREGKSEFTLDSSNGGTFYSLEGRGPDLDPLVALYKAIRAGSVLPTESWESDQVGAGKPSYGDLEMAVDRMNGMIDEAKEQLKLAEQRVADQKVIVAARGIAFDNLKALFDFSLEILKELAEAKLFGRGKFRTAFARLGNLDVTLPPEQFRTALREAAGQIQRS